MSRSRKHTPIFKDNQGSAWKDKRIANQKVRHSEVLEDGAFYRRVYNSYDIHDYIWAAFNGRVNEPWSKLMSK